MDWLTRQFKKKNNVKTSLVTQMTQLVRRRYDVLLSVAQVDLVIVLVDPERSQIKLLSKTLFTNESLKISSNTLIT